MAFMDLHSDVMDIRLTPFILSQLPARELDPKRFVFYDFSTRHVDERFLLSSDYPFLKEEVVFLPYTSKTIEDDVELFGESIFQNLEYSIGSVNELSIDGVGYVQVPRFNIRFNGGVVRNSYLKNNVCLYIESNDIMIRYKLASSEVYESVDGSTRYMLGGKSYDVFNNYVFCDISEEGSKFDINNFEIFLYEYDVLSGEYREVILGEKYIDEYGRELTVLYDLDDIVLMLDNEIDPEIFCKHVDGVVDPHSIIYKNTGIVNIESAGIMCVGDGKFPKIYINRTEGALGEEC